MALKINKAVIYLSLILLLGLLLRLAVSPYFTHYSDMGLWKFWADEVVRVGIHGFFDQISWTDYLPFYFYFLFALGKISVIFNIDADLLFKMPAILADLGTGVLIFLLLKHKSLAIRLSLTSLYIFNPAIFANSAMWGQVDGLGAFLIVLALYFFMNQRIALLGIAISAAVLFKPLYLIIIPIFLLAVYKTSFQKLPNLISSIAIATFLIAAPFASNILETPQLIFDRYSVSAGQYKYASVNAFNFWGALGKNWASDEITFQGVPYHMWGLLLYANFFFLLIFNLFLEKFKDYKGLLTGLTVALMIAFLCIFTFPTRAHERHLFSFFPFLLLLVNRGKVFATSYILLSIIYILNLYYGIKYLESGFIFDEKVVRLISAAEVTVTLVLVVYSVFIWKGLRDEKS